MNCGESRELFAEYADGLLGAAEKDGLEAHLRFCQRCSSEVEGQKRVRVLVRSAARFSAPEGFSRRVMAEIRAGGEGGLFGWLWAMPVHLKLIEAAAVAAVIFIGVHSAGFLSESIMGARTARNGEASLVASVSVEYLDPVPPESMADVYLTASENGNEN